MGQPAPEGRSRFLLKVHGLDRSIFFLSRRRLILEQGLKSAYGAGLGLPRLEQATAYAAHSMAWRENTKSAQMNARITASVSHGA